MKQQIEKTEEDLRLFHSAFESAVTGIVITDQRRQDNPIIYCNASFEKLTGYQASEIVGRNCRFLQAADRHQEARSIISDAVNKGETCTVQIRNYKKDGTLFWNELTLSPVTDPKSGLVTHMVGIQNDITERKNAEAQLAEERLSLEKRVQERTTELKASEAFLSGIIETIRESLLVLDASIKIISVNKHFCDFFKVSGSDVIGKKLYDLGNGQWDNPQLRELLEKILPTQNPFEGFKVQHSFPLIGKKTILLNARQISYEGNLQNRILLAMEDVTEMTEYDQRKDDFISIASHEMRTPLTTISGYMQLLQMQIEEENILSLEQPVTKIIKHVGKLDQLIGQLLDVARMQEGKITFDYSIVDFDDFVHEVISQIRVIDKDREIKVIGETKKMVCLDVIRVEQVISNLFANARKYAAKSKLIELHLGVLNDAVIVSVKDFGPGIDQKYHRKIFERFYRADDVQHKFPGIGIGLYVCDMIVKEHGGSLWVSSEEGSGANFSFTLPFQAPLDGK